MIKIFPLCCGVALLFCALAGPAKAQDVPPTPTALIESVASAAGKSEVRVIDPGGNQRFAGQGDTLDAGAKIVTENGQTVVLQMAERTEISIGPSTSFQIDQFTKQGPQQSVFSLAYGMMRALVTKKYGDNETFAVRTKDSIMGVRGTEFVLQNDPISDETQVHTFSGTVRFANATADAAGDLRRLHAAQAVPAGMSSRLSRGMSAPTPAQPFDAQKFRNYLKSRSPAFESRVHAYHPELSDKYRNVKNGARVPHAYSPAMKERIQKEAAAKKKVKLSKRRARLQRRNARFGAKNRD